MAPDNADQDANTPGTMPVNLTDQMSGSTSQYNKVESPLIPVRPLYVQPQPTVLEKPSQWSQKLARASKVLGRLSLVIGLLLIGFAFTPGIGAYIALGVLLNGILIGPFLLLPGATAVIMGLIAIKRSPANNRPKVGIISGLIGSIIGGFILVNGIFAVSSITNTQNDIRNRVNQTEELIKQQQTQINIQNQVDQPTIESNR